MLIAPTLSLLLAVPCTWGLAPTYQDGVPETVQQTETYPPESWEAYNALLGKYINAVGSFQFETKELYKKKVARSEWPPHPAREYFPQFRALGEKGNGEAVYWLIENMLQAVDAPKERLELTKQFFTLLATKHASEAVMIRAIQDLTSRRKRLGAGYIAATLRTITENSELLNVDAMAMYGEASILFNNGEVATPEDLERVVALWHVLVDGYAGTKAAKLAAEHLFRRTIREVQEAQHVWLDKVLDLHAEGIGPEGWPPFPLDAYLGQFEALASTGHVLSMRWVEGYYPGYANALKEGIQPALLYAGGEPLRGLVTGDIQWKDIRFHILRVLFEIFPDEPWVLSAITWLQSNTFTLVTDQAAPVLQTLIDSTSDELVRNEAMYTLAMLYQHSRKCEENAKALELFQCVMDQAPVERLRKDAEQAHRKFSWTMPGAPLPTFGGTDAEGFEVNSAGYQGRVMVLFFWLFASPESVEELPWINELAVRYPAESCVVLGVNSDTTTRMSFLNRANAKGITWRNILQQARGGKVSSIFDLGTFPTTFIVDAGGVIRGRNLPHDQAQALIEKLIADVAGKAPEDAGTGSGGGGGQR